MATNRCFTGQTSVFSAQPVETKPAALQPCSLEHTEGMMKSVVVGIMTVTAIKEKSKWSLLIQQGINDKEVASAGQHRVVLMTFLSLTASTEQKDIAGLGPTW